MRWVGCQPNRPLDPLQRQRASKSRLSELIHYKVYLERVKTPRADFNAFAIFAGSERFI
jgi:hypothetical protein